MVDFGIAKATKSASFTQSGHIKGKFFYMSPEQARGDRIDQRADVFAAGAILYELVTGRMLYAGHEEDASLLQKVRMADYPRPSSVCPDIDPQLEKIILKALARDVGQRFQTARDFQLALSSYARRIDLVDSVHLSELMHRIFETGGGSTSAIYEVVDDGGAPGAIPAAKPWSQEDEEASTAVYGRERVDEIIEELEVQYGGQPAKGFRRESLGPAAEMESIDLEIDDSRYRNPTKITAYPERPEHHKPPLLLFIAALAGLMLIAWTFIFFTNAITPEPESTPQVHGGDAGLELGFKITSTPAGAEILIDGEQVSFYTPATLFNISKGQHQLTLKAPFHAPASQSIFVEDGSSTTLELTPLQGVLRITTNPSRAEIKVDGVSIGNSPVTIDGVLMSKSHQVTAILSGYKDLVRTIEWKDDNPLLKLDFALEADNLRYAKILTGLHEGAYASLAGFLLTAAEEDNPTEQW